MNRRVALLLALVIAAVAAATTGGAAGAAQEVPADPRLAAVNALLDEREAAVATGDPDRWMATIDPQAPSSFRDGQRRLFDGWRALPIEGYALEARVDDVGDLSAGLGDRLAPYAADETFLPETRRRYRFAGYDEADAVEYLWYTYVRRGDRWYVAGASDVEHLGLDTAVSLWDFGPVRARATEHFLVLSHPEQAERADQLAVVAERAMARFAELWDRPWDRRLPIVLPGSVEELERILQTTFDLDNFVAFVAYDAVRDDGYETTAPRMYIQDRNLSRHREEFQFDTLVHELVHAATAMASGPHVEAWVHEGVAEWVTNGRHRQGGVPRGSDGELPEPYEFTTGGSAAIVAAYEESEAATAFLAARHGSDVPIRFLEALGARRATPGDADHNASAVLGEIAGMGLEAFEDDWAG